MNIHDKCLLHFTGGVVGILYEKMALHTHSLPRRHLKGTYGVDAMKSWGIPFRWNRVEAQLPRASRGIGASPGPLVGGEDGERLE